MSYTLFQFNGSLISNIPANTSLLCLWYQGYFGIDSGVLQQRSVYSVGMCTI